MTRDCDLSTGTCPVCKRKGERHWRRNCLGVSVIKRVASFVDAVFRWEMAGKPLRNSDEIEKILDLHCRPCKHFIPTDDDTNGCSVCGCQKLLGIGGLRKKIGMATESCPLKIPKWQAEDTTRDS